MIHDHGEWYKLSLGRVGSSGNLLGRSMRMIWRFVLLLCTFKGNERSILHIEFIRTINDHLSV